MSKDDLIFDICMVLLAIMMFGFLLGVPISMIVSYERNKGKVEETWVQIYPGERWVSTNWESLNCRYYFLEFPDYYEFHRPGRYARKIAVVSKENGEFSQRIEVLNDCWGSSYESRRFKKQDGKIFIRMKQLPDSSLNSGDL